MKFRFWKKKKEKILFPYQYGKIVFTEEAVEDGIFDVFQKEIRIIRNGLLVEKIPYTKADVMALQKVQGIPIVDLTKDDGEDFEFEHVFALTGTISEVRRR